MYQSLERLYEESLCWERKVCSLTMAHMVLCRDVFTNDKSSESYIYTITIPTISACVTSLERIYIMYTKKKSEFNVMIVLVYPIWLWTCIPGICCSITLPCSMELYISYFIDPWVDIETHIPIYTACTLNQLVTNTCMYSFTGAFSLHFIQLLL